MAKDFKYTTDLVIQNGDFLITESDMQHVADMLIAHPGHYKHVPWIGIGIEDYIKSPITPSLRAELERDIKIQIEADGGKRTIVVSDRELNLTIKTNYGQ